MYLKNYMAKMYSKNVDVLNVNKNVNVIARTQKKTYNAHFFFILNKLIRFMGFLFDFLIDRNRSLKLCIQGCTQKKKLRGSASFIK